jgi:hypothetical protein
MLDRLFRVLGNLLYLAPFAVMRFKRREPNSSIVIADATKAQKLYEDTEAVYGTNWAFSRRGVLILTEDELVCGSWEIPLSTVSKATLVHIKTFITNSGVLKVSTLDGQHYQFGIPFSPPWEQQAVLKLDHENIDPKYAAISVAARLIVVVVIILLAVQCSVNYLGR